MPLATAWTTLISSLTLYILTFADDPENAMPEDPSVNRARGNDTMSYSEELAAQLDNEVLAAEIDANYTGDDYSYPLMMLHSFSSKIERSTSQGNERSR